MRHAWWALVITTMAGCGGLLIDDPCEDPSECALSTAVCADIGDGVTRCEAACSSDEDCGNGAACLFDADSTSTSGLCWRLCDVSSDCAVGAWDCLDLVAGSEQGYCTF